LTFPAELVEKSTMSVNKKKRVVDSILNCALIQTLDEGITHPSTTTHLEIEHYSSAQHDFKRPPSTSSLSHYVSQQKLVVYSPSDKQLGLISLLMKDIDRNWITREPLQFMMKKLYADEKVDVLPKKILIIPRNCYCPIAKKHHKVSKTQLIISQDSKVTILCLSTSHYDKPHHVKTKLANLNSMLDLVNMKAADKEFHNSGRLMVKMTDRTALDSFLYYTWGIEEWRKAFNNIYSFIKKSGVIAQKYTDGNTISIAESTDVILRKYFKNARAYDVETDETSETERNWKLTWRNPFDAWFEWNDRKNYLDIVFEPKSMLYTHSTGNMLNSWFGSPLVPKFSRHPCPRIFNHIDEVMVSRNQEHYAYMLNYFTWVVQRPFEKPLVALVFSTPEEGKKKKYKSIFAITS